MNKKILFVIPSLSLGGAEKVVTRLASRLVEKGFPVGILIFYKCNKEYNVHKGVEIINISRGDMNEYKKMTKYQRLKLIRKEVKKFNPDIVLPFLNHVCIYIFISLLFSKFRRKIVFTENNNPKLAEKESAKLKYFLQNFVRKIIVQNDGEKKELSKKQQKKTIIIANPIDDIYFEINNKLNETPMHIISIGRLNEQKNYPLALRSFSKVLEKYPNMIYHIFGQGEEKEQIEQLILELGIQNNVILEGFVLDSKQIYKDADIYLMTSNYEGLPNALAESLAVGIPSISTNCDFGPSDLIENEKMGILVNTNDINSLVNGIFKMIDNYKIYLNETSYVKENMKKKYSLEKITNDWIKVFEEF